MSEASTYRANEPAVISEVIEGEAIILNFESGCYYNLNDSARAIWQDLLAGLVPDLIAERQARRYGLESALLADDVAELVEELLLEQLIVPLESSAAGESPIESETTEYVKPALEKFTDLQELLLLDPIHDVDESGRLLTGA